MAGRSGIIDAVFALLLGLTAAVALAVLWNVSGLAPARSRQYGYELSQFFTPVTGGFVLAYAIAAFLAGWVTRAPLAVAIGMVVVLPAAACVEMARHASHGFLHLEVLSLWIPAFLIALASALSGKIAWYLFADDESRGQTR